MGIGEILTDQKPSDKYLHDKSLKEKCPHRQKLTYTKAHIEKYNPT